ncbi:MAG: hypothetical protein ACI9PP_001615, partial [Halobacteriales archaeon]
QFFAAGMGLLATLWWLGLELRWRILESAIGIRWPVYRE